LRKGRLSGDFADWLSAEDGLGLQELAARAAKVGCLGLSLEGMREQIVRLCDQELATR